MPLAFLPPELTGHATDDLLFDAALQVFRHDFIATGAKLGTSQIQIATKISTEGWEESFRHLATREPIKGSPRQNDPDRARRVPWVKPIIENYNDPQLTYFMYLEGSGYVRHYIWNQPDKYVVILESKNTQLRLVTGFNIDEPWKLYDLKKKLSKAIK